MKKALITLAAVTLLSGGTCLMGCKASSAHDTTRSLVWQTGVEMRTVTAQGPDVVAYDKLEVPSLAESVLGKSEPVEETPEP